MRGVQNTRVLHARVSAANEFFTLLGANFRLKWETFGVFCGLNT